MQTNLFTWLLCLFIYFFFLLFTEKPTFVNAKTEQHPEEGKTAEIKCEVEGGEGGIFWKYNGKVVKEGLFYQIFSL